MRKRITKAMLAKFQAYLIENDRRPATIEKYMRDVDKLYQFLPAHKRIDKKTVLAFKQQLISKYKPTSVNSILAAVNQFLAFIGRKSFQVRQLRIQKQLFCREETELTKAEYLRLLHAAKRKKDKRLYLILQTICGTGIRVSELSDITAAAVARGYADVTAKNKTRRVFLPIPLRKLLRSYLKENRRNHGPVFLTSGNQPVNRSNIWKEMKALSKAADVCPEKVFPHNLRHLFACTYYQRERDIIKLADILGHCSVETTRIYTVSSGKEHAKHVERLGLIISG